MKSVQVFNTGDQVWVSCRTKFSNTWMYLCIDWYHKRH